MNIITGDCLEHLAAVPERSVRLAFSDPPYNIGLNYGDHYDDAKPDDVYRAWTREWVSAVRRVLTDDGSLWILLNHEWAWRVCGDAVEHAGFHLRQWVTWYESFGTNATGKFNRCSRPLLWLTKSKTDFVFHPGAVNRPSDRQTKYGDKRANPAGKNWDDVWGINPPIPRVCGTFAERLPKAMIRGKGVQLPQLPLALMRPIVGCASDPGDLVLDPHTGTGSTAVACYELGRRFLGFELSPETAEIARERIAALQPVAS